MIKNQLRKKYNLKNLKFPIEYYIYDLLLVTIITRIESASFDDNLTEA